MRLTFESRRSGTEQDNNQDEQDETSRYQLFMNGKQERVISVISSREEYIYLIHSQSFLGHFWSFWSFLVIFGHFLVIS